MNDNILTAMQIITTPTADWLKAKLVDCNERFWVASPYVTSFLNDKMAQPSSACDRRLVTNTDIRTFISKSSDIDTLDSLLNAGVTLKSVNRLHAKAYIIDNKAALVTSANATHSGMRHNRECGIATEDIGVIRELAELIDNGFGVDGGAQDITRTELSTIRGLAEQFASQRAEISMQGFAEEEPPKFVIKDASEQFKLLSQFSGWMALTMEGVLSLKQDTFTMDDLEAACMVKASEQYPDNKHVRAKLRQQLQQLRDLGLVDFMGDGTYRRLVC